MQWSETVEKVIAVRRAVDPRVRAVADFMVGDFVWIPGLRRAVEVVGIGLDHGHDAGSHDATCFKPEHVVYTVRLRQPRSGDKEFANVWHGAALRMAGAFQIGVTPGYRC